MSTNNSLPKQPYPGLRPYRQDEADIFFGRAEQINRMLGRLEDNFFLAVVGSSGSGKSSLVRAGLLPSLLQGYLLDTGSDWEFIIITPGDDPYQSLATEFIERTTGESNQMDIAFTQAMLESSPKGFLDVLSETELSEGKSVLLLVDQFEEIFRFQLKTEQDAASSDSSIHQRRNQAKAFVNLLLTTVQASVNKNAKWPVYVVITMRSDYIGNCETFQDLPQAVSDSQFLVPLMTREQMHEAIEKPLNCFGWHSETALINQILNDAGSIGDQLPLMQHALMRSWFTGVERASAEKILTRSDYLHVGGMSKALSQHLEEAWGSLHSANQHVDNDSESLEQIVARALFISLCERNNEGQLIRRPVQLENVARIVDVDPLIVMRVVREFQKDERNFIVTRPAGELTPDTVLDISHETLLRQWDRLRQWFATESESAETYKRLVYHASQHKLDNDYVLMGLDLRQAEVWKANLFTPTTEWAKRYAPEEANSGHSSFNQVLELIASSKLEEQRRQLEIEKAKAEKEERLKQDIQKQRRYKWTMVGLFFLSSAVALVFWQQLYRGTKAQERLFITTAKSFARTDPEKALKYVLAALEIQPRLSATNSRISMTAIDIISTALASPRREKFHPISDDSDTLSLPYPQQGAIWSLLLKNNEDELITAGSDGTIKVWDRDGRSMIKNVRKDSPSSTSNFNRQNPILSMVQLGNGDLISGDAGGLIRRWTLTKKGSTITPTLVWSTNNASGAIISLAPLNDSEFIAGHNNGRISHWKTTNGTFIREETKLPSAVWSLLPVGNNEYYSAGQDGSILHWKDGSIIQSNRVNEPIRTLIRVSDRDFIAGGVYGTLRRWSDSNLDSLSDPVKTNQGGIRTMIRLDDDRFIAAGTDGTFAIWQKNLQKLSESMESGQGTLLALATTADGSRLFAAGSDGSVSRWDLNTKPMTIPISVKNTITKAIFSAEDAFVLGDESGGLSWRDRYGKEKGSYVQTKQGSISYITELTQNKDIVTAGLNNGKGTLALWSFDGNTKVKPFDTQQGEIISIIELGNGNIVSVDKHGILREWDKDLRPLKGPLKIHPQQGQPVRQQTFHSAVKLRNNDLLIGGTGEIIRRKANGTFVHEFSIDTLPTPKTMKQGLKVSPLKSLFELSGGDRVAGGADGNLIRLRTDWFGHPQPRIESLAYGSLLGLVETKNHELLVGSEDGNIYTIKDLVAVGGPIKSRLGSVTFLWQNKSNELIAGWIEGKSLSIRRWPAPSEAIREACQRIGTRPSKSRISWQAVTNQLKRLGKYVNIDSDADKARAIPDEERIEQNKVDNLANNFCQKQKLVSQNP